MNFQSVLIEVNEIPTNAIVFCRIAGVYLIPATDVQPLNLTCQFPPYSTLSFLNPSLTSLDISLELSFNGQNYSSSSLFYQYLDPVLSTINLFSISPHTGPTIGGTTVIVSYPSTTPPLNPMCRFGSVIVTGTAPSATQFQCLSPPYASEAIAPVTISFNGVDFSSVSFVFSYDEQIALGSCYPVQGSSKGGTPVLITGKGFKPYPELTCYFGAVNGIVSYLDQYRILCVSPSASISTVQVSISFNGEQIYQVCAYDYRASEQLISISPTSGPKSGGTILSLQMSYYYGGTDGVCRFGTYLTAVLQNVGYYCLTPAFNVIQQATPVLVSVSSNGVDFEPGIAFSYYENIQIQSITPALINDANVQRTFQLTVTNAGNASGAIVKQTNVVYTIPVTVKTTTSVQVILSPTESLGTGNAFISLTGNGQNYSPQIYITVIPAAQLTSVAPTFGLTTGDLVIRLSGSNFFNYPIICSFGTTQVPVRFLSANTVECVNPANVTPATVAIVLSFDSQLDVTNAMQFRYWSQPTLSAVQPTSGRNLEQVTVHVTTSAQLIAAQVRVGQETLRNSLWTFPTFSFLAPANPAGALSIVLSWNFLEFLNIGNFIYSGECVIGQYCPVELASQSLPCPPGWYCPYADGSIPYPCPPGSISLSVNSSSCTTCPNGQFCPYFEMTSGLTCPMGYLCTIKGLSFLSVLTRCAAGYACNNNISKACRVGLWCGPVSVNDTLSVERDYRTPQHCNAGSECISGLSTSQFGSNPCPAGYYCNQGIKIPCPAGSSCPIPGLFTPNLCRPGYYSSTQGQTVCSPSDLGFISPGSGNKAEYTCPAGYICAVRARPSPSNVCPGGSFCLQGRKTLTLDVDFGPRTCIAGTYCLIGVSFDSVFDGNVSYPQTCIMGTYCISGTDSPAAIPCPEAYYCPQGSSTPVEVDPGYFAGGIGNGLEQACAPGTFSNVTGVASCMTCPAGYYCQSDATIVPTICPAGSYRRADPNIVYCELCPEGTWSNVTGLRSVLQCSICEASVVCAGQGLTNITQAEPCPEGYVCGEMTTAFTVLTTPCPGGYWCGLSTATEADYGICEPGYYCPPGTANSTKYQHPCNPGYYCPEATNATIDLTGAFLYIHQANYSEVIDAKTAANAGSCAAAQMANYSSADAQQTALKNCEMYKIPAFPTCAEDLALPAYLVHQYTDLKCPQGTTSQQGAQCVGQCQSIGESVTVGHYNPLSPGRQLQSSDNVTLSPMALAKLSFDFSNLNANFKYSKQYSIYLAANNTGQLQMPPYFSSGLVDVDLKFDLVMFDFSSQEQDVAISIALHNALFLPFSNQFTSTMQMQVMQPSRANYGTNDLFIIILWDNLLNNVQMPFNLVSFDQSTGNPSKLLVMDSGVTNNWQGPQTSITPFDSSFWAVYSASTYAMPWLPFFANCETYGNYLYLFSILESADYCTLYDPADTVFSQAFPTSGFFTKADSCAVTLQCYYAENVQGANQYWFNINTETELFLITRDPQPVGNMFSPSSSFDSIFTAEVVALSDNIIPVKFIPEIDATGVPTNVTMSITYYQVDENLKRLVSVQVRLGGYVNTNDTNPMYELTIKYTALDWFDLLNKFEFAVSTYIALFSGIGVVLLLALSVIYWLHRLATRVKDPPKMHFVLYWKTTALPPALGTIIGAVPAFVACGFIILLRNNNPLINISGDWSAPVIPDALTLAVYQRGRVALSLLYTGALLIYFGVTLMEPVPPASEEDEEESEGSIPESTVAEEKPLEAKRTRSMDSAQTDFSSQSTQQEGSSTKEFRNAIIYKRRLFLLTSLFLSLWTTFKFELSYTVIMGSNLFQFLLLFFVLDIVLFQLFEFALEEALLVAPIFAALTINEMIVTMAANDFVSFIEAYVFVMTLILVLRMYINPLLKRVGDKTMLLAIELIAKYHWVEVLFKRLVMRQLKMHNSLASDLSRDSGTNMEGLLETMTYYSSQVQALMMAPLVFSIVYLFADETEMPTMYGIRQSDVVFYMLFSAVVIVPQLIIDIYAFHLLETLYDYKFFDYFTYCSYRFKMRTRRWLQGADSKFDQSLLLPWRSLDHMCYSSQYYFSVTLTSWGIMMFSLAWTIMLRNAYNPFNDPIGLLLIAVVGAFGMAITFILKQISLLLRLWKPHAPTVFSQEDPDQTDKDQVVNLIEEYMEENALRIKIKTNLFKGKFLKKNKEWVFENLELIAQNTPEVLNMLRTKYRELLDIDNEDSKKQKLIEEREQQLKALPYNRPDRLRDDITEDATDPETGNGQLLVEKECAPLLRRWLDSARLIKGLRNIVKKPEAMMSQCELCENVEDLLLVPELDFYALLKEYRESQRGLPIVTWKWKKFYESRQVLHTFCLECSYLHTIQKRTDQVQSGLLTRMAAEALRPRVCVATPANPIAKKMIVKWLLEARARLLHNRASGTTSHIQEVGSSVSFSSRSLSFAISDVARSR